jgi:hypothetical protein
MATKGLRRILLPLRCLPVRIASRVHLHRTDSCPSITRGQEAAHVLLLLRLHAFEEGWSAWPDGAANAFNIAGRRPFDAQRRVVFLRRRPKQYDRGRPRCALRLLPRPFG